MTTQYRAVPVYETPRQIGKNSTPAWYRFDQAVHLGTPPGAEQALTVGTSPWSYQATQGGFAIVTGGTVSQIKFSRVSAHVTGQTSGVFPLSLGDILTITYSGKPTVIFVSQ